MVSGKEHGNKFSLEGIASFLEKLAEKSDSVYWLSSPDFERIEYISPAYEKIWGRSREILYTEPQQWITYLHPDDVKDHHPIRAMAERVAKLGPIARYDENYRIVRPNGEIRWIIDRGFPIYDDLGNCRGVTGVAIDITSEKEAAQIKLENEINKRLVQEQEKFVKTANQVAHDIRSPMASLQMIIKSCTHLPEAERIALREVAMSITDIANNLLSQYRAPDTAGESPERQPLLVSVTLMQLLTDKKYEYPSVVWDYKVSQSGHFAFIKMEPSAFKRTFSNLINNAVEACEGKTAKIVVQLNADNEWITITIKDNGKGMPPAVIEKIMQQIAITSDKKEGHGIGLTQVRETLQRNQGEMAIDSTPGNGTQITLTFPRISAPAWMAEEIKLEMGDIVVILDDDSSIHSAWDTHLQGVATETSDIQLRHFSVGQEALDFILSISTDRKPHILLLTDYELLKQDLDGLTVIEKSGIERSILVTSHFTNPAVRERAAKVGSKILPKQMAAEIPIEVIKKEIKSSSPTTDVNEPVKKVDIVVVDDDKGFVNNLIIFAFIELEVDCYYNPDHFLKNISRYAKDTKMVIDNQFTGSRISGVDLAKKLHEQGYTRLYILSGKNFSPDEVPDYVKVILKSKIGDIAKIADE